jgi:hypothetical protein
MHGVRRIHVVACLIGCWVGAADQSQAATPSPLEDAYWRFEEGSSGSPVSTAGDPVLDSVNGNHMRTFSSSTAPMYTAFVPAAIVPATGQPNNLALNFSPNQDIFSSGKNINYPITSAFTLEASFRLDSLGTFQTIVAKDGMPTANPLPPLALKVRDNNLLQIELIDAGGILRSVTSGAPVQGQQWYHAAVVNDGTSMALYLDRNDGAGYVLQGNTEVAGALYQNDSPWAIGRGFYNNSPADWMNGFIDEVRLSNEALDSTQFLFYVPEPASVAALVLSGSMLLRRRSRLSH